MRLFTPRTINEDKRIKSKAELMHINIIVN